MENLDNNQETAPVVEAEVTATGQEADQGVTTQENNVEGTTTNEGETASHAELGGTKDWYSIDSYDTTGMSEQAISQLKGSLSSIASQRNEELRGRKKHSFDTYEDVEKLFNENPDLAAQIQEKEQLNTTAEEAVKNPSEYIGEAVKNWDKLNNNQRTDFYNALAPSDKLTFENSLTIQKQNQTIAHNNYVAMEKKNAEELGEGYTAMSESLVSNFMKAYQANPRKMAYLALASDGIAKKNYELGKSEALKASGGIPLVVGSDNVGANTSVPTDGLKAMEAALGKHGAKDMKELISSGLS